MNTILTIGHSNRAFSTFLQKLQENKIEILVDVRTYPRSRFCPQFNRKRLSEELRKADITYIFKGVNLGGMKENIEYQETIDEITAMVMKGKFVCVMCSEGDYKECHRHSMLEPSFIEKRLNVEHILYEKNL